VVYEGHCVLALIFVHLGIRRRSLRPLIFLNVYVILPSLPPRLSGPFPRTALIIACFRGRVRIEEQVQQSKAVPF
jgi:hypothetical protein